MMNSYALAFLLVLVAICVGSAYSFFKINNKFGTMLWLVTGVVCLLLGWHVILIS